MSDEPHGLSFEDADKAASIAHDYIWGKNGVTQKQASDAIWLIHEVLRPLIPPAAHPDYERIVAEIRAVSGQETP